MGVRFPSAVSTTIVNATLTTTTDTVILTTPPMNLPFDGAVVMLFAWVLWTTGTGATGATPSLRRGTTTGATKLNLAGNYPVTANANRIDTFVYADLGGLALAEQQYSLTLAQVAATANAAAVDGAIIALIL